MVKKALGPFENGKIRLRLLDKNDLPLTLKWRNQDDIRCWFFHSAPLQPDQHAGWFDQYCQRGDDYVFIIEEIAGGGLPVGQVSLYHIDPLTNKAEFGRLMIGEPAARGKGLAKSATQLILQVGFEHLGLDEIYLEVFSNNAAARKIYEDCGFINTGEQQGVVRMSIKRTVEKAR